ncbi:protein kinase [Penicillium digitatum]|uniref:Protein kinase n=1 Tax=Penicillium digitatum TaxID=36651 RepID=A0A7T7BPM9_PENDI|nr:protein kinase [Penicillium digitatum]
MTLRRLLLALDYLHTEMNITHTDLKTDNVMLSLEDTTMLADFADEEIRQPSPRKIIDQSRTIYQSRKFRRPIWDLFEGRHLFKNVFDKNGNYDPFKHIALMVALIGPPPAVSMQRSETTGQCSLIAMVLGLLIKMRLCGRNL